MNIATIRAALEDQLDVFSGTYGEGTTLTPAQTDLITDALAANVLNTVSPTNNYPPVKK